MRVIDSNRVASGLLVWMGTIAVGLLGSVLYRLELGESVELVLSAFWLVMAVVLCFALAQVALGVEPPALPWIAVALELVTTVLSEFAQHAPKLLGVSASMMAVVNLPLMFLSLAERAVLLAVIVQLLGKKHTWGVMAAVGIFGVSLMRMALPWAISFGAVGFEFYKSPAYLYGLLALSMLTGGATVAMLWVARQTVLEGGGSEPSPREAGLAPAPVHENSSPGADFAIGAVVLLIGIGVTVVSMSAASGGGRYVVATGAIGVGLARIIRGFIKLSRGS